MKREYKFRAWDNVNKCFFEPTFRAYKGELEDLHIDMSGSLCMRTMDKFIHLDSMEPGRFDIMKYTGRKDVNGKEIYEGDLHGFEIEIDDKTTWCYLPVVFDNGAFWLDESFEKDGSMLTLLCEYNDEPLNIVGNRHQNPEFINKH